LGEGGKLGTPETWHLNREVRREDGGNLTKKGTSDEEKRGGKMVNTTLGESRKGNLSPLRGEVEEVVILEEKIEKKFSDLRRRGEKGNSMSDGAWKEVQGGRVRKEEDGGRASVFLSSG